MLDSSLEVTREMVEAMTSVLMDQCDFGSRIVPVSIVHALLRELVDKGLPIQLPDDLPDLEGW